MYLSFLKQKKTMNFIKNTTKTKKIVEVEMMLASGEIKCYNQSSDEFPAILCSLGCLGVILSMTVQCEKKFKLEQIEYCGRLEDVKLFGNFLEIWFSSTFF
jgi:FAD/FMN-containing dehydrogenase